MGTRRSSTIENLVGILLLGLAGLFLVRYSGVEDPRLLGYAGGCLLLVVLLELVKRARRDPGPVVRSGLAARLVAGIFAFRTGDGERARDYFTEVLELAGKLPARASPLIRALQLVPVVLQSERPVNRAFWLATATQKVTEELLTCRRDELQHLGMALILLGALYGYCRSQGRPEEARQLLEAYRRVYEQMLAACGPGDPSLETLGLRPIEEEGEAG